MTVLFFALYLTGLSIGSRFRLTLNSPATLIIVLYFILVEKLLSLFLAVEFANFLWKAIFFLCLIALPTAVIAAISRIGLRRILLGVAISFLLTLPISRPTTDFARVGTNLKLRVIPSRFIENISRFPPEGKDVEMLLRDCDAISQNEKTLLFAYVRPLLKTRSITSPCIQEIQLTSGRQPPLDRLSDRTPQEWLDDFQKATPAMRVVIFDQLRMQRNPALLDQAIDVIEGDQDSLIIAAVRYLRELSGRYIGNDKARWKEWRTSKVSRLNVVMSSSQPVAPPAEKGFSAVEAFDDLAASQKTGEDFLQLYLRIHFPQSINESNLETLKDSIEGLKGESVPMQYRKGVLFFFLALAETKRMAAGYPENADEVFSHWNSSLDHFRAAGSIGKSMSEELIKIINLADENRDQKLDSNELEHIIQSRS